MDFIVWIIALIISIAVLLWLHNISKNTWNIYVVLKNQEKGSKQGINEDYVEKIRQEK